MALARIITELTKYSDGLAKDLREKGFDVQTFVPGSPATSAADLELNLKECSPNEVSELMADRLGKRDMCVFLTSGAMAGQVRSIDLFVLRPKSASQENEVPEMATAEADAHAQIPVVEESVPVSMQAGQEDTPVSLQETLADPRASVHSAADHTPAVVDELFPESLHDAPEIAPTRDTVPAPQKVGAFTSLKDGFQHVLARCIAITSDLRKSRVDRLQSAAVEDATEELVPHGLIGQAFLDTPEEPKLAAEFESPAPERDAWEEDQTIIESLHVQDADDYRAIDPPLVDPPAIGHPAEKDLPDHILVAGIPVPMFLQAEELHNEEVQNEVQGTPVPELENIPVMLNLPPGHVLEDVGSPVSDSGPQNAPLQTRATDEEALGGASQLSIRATQSAPKNIRVITIRPVRRDKRLWNAAILAVSCAVLALAVISLPKHLSSKLSGTSANSSQAGSIAEPAQTPDNVATELTDPLQTSAHTSVTTHSKPARAFSLSTSRVQAASQKQALPKARTRSSGNDFVAKDTFVDYRNRRTTAPAPAQQTSVKRVVVEN